MITGLYGVACFLIGFVMGMEITRRGINRNFVLHPRKDSR